MPREGREMVRAGSFYHESFEYGDTAIDMHFPRHSFLRTASLHYAIAGDTTERACLATSDFTAHHDSVPTSIFKTE